MKDAGTLNHTVKKENHFKGSTTSKVKSLVGHE